MKRLLATLLVVLTTPAFAQKGPAPQTIFDSFHKPIWEFHSNALKDDCTFDELYLYNKVLVAKVQGMEGCGRSIVYGLNSSTNKMIWKKDWCEIREDNIISVRKNKLACYSIYTGKEKWEFDMGKRNIASIYFSIYLSDSLIFLLTCAQDNPQRLEADTYTWNPEESKTGMLIINQYTGRLIKEINDIVIKDPWGIKYKNKNIIFLQSHEAVTAFDLETEKELWQFKKAHHPDWFGEPDSRVYHYPVELLQTEVDYVFICGRGDTIFLDMKVLSKGAKLGSETIIGVDLKTGNILSEFWTGDLSKNQFQYNFVRQKSFGGYLFFIKRQNLLLDKRGYTKTVDYVLACIDLLQCKQKWEYDLSQDNKKYTVPDDESNLFADTSEVYFTTYETIVCLIPESGRLLWEKKIEDTSINEMTFTKDFIICNIYNGNEKYESSMLVFDKSDVSKSAHQMIDFKVCVVDDPNHVMYVVDKNKRILKMVLK